MNQAPASVFRAMDPELPFIAVNAALEVDNLLHKRYFPTPNLKQLSALLRSSTCQLQQEPENPVRHFMDPASVEVFQRAFAGSHDYHLTSLSDIAKKASEIATELESAPSQDDLLKILKHFCLELSRQALATRHTMQQTRADTRYKKIAVI